MRHIRRWMASVAVALCATIVRADLIVDFEGLSNHQVIGSYYAAHHLYFSPSLVSVVDRDHGGTGKFDNNPSGHTVAGWLSSRNVFISSDVGFTDQVGLWYSTRQNGVIVNIWSGPQGQGDLLATATLMRNSNGKHKVWDELLIPFNGIARSLEFVGKGGTRTYFDDLTLSIVPVPAAGILGAMGLMCAARLRRRIQ